MATACTQYFLAGFGQECLGSASGLKRLAIAPARDFELVPDEGASAHTATFSATSTASTFYEYYISDEAASITSTLNVNNQNGVRYYLNTVTATLVRMRPEKHMELIALANERLVVLVQDANGTWWGYDNAKCTSQTAQSGLAADDLSGYQLEIQGRNPVLAYGITNSPAIDTHPVYEQ